MSRRAPASSMPELYEEVARMPEHYRAPIVLCYLEGQSHEEAARILRCRLRTLQTRLQRGKAKLRVRLVRRGLAPGTGLLAAGLAEAEHPAAAAAAAVTAANGMLPVGLSDSTARASVQFAAARRPASRHPHSDWLKVSEDPVLESPATRGRLGGRPGYGPDPGLLRTGRRGPGNRQAADTVTIRVLDDRGRPISGADVWMQVSLDERRTGRSAMVPPMVRAVF